MTSTRLEIKFHRDPDLVIGGGRFLRDGHEVGNLKSASQTPGVAAVMRLFVEWASTPQKPLPISLSHWHAKSADSTVRHPSKWCKELFGAETSIKKLIKRHDNKLRLNTDALAASNIHVFVDDQRLTDSRDLRQLAEAVTAKFQTMEDGLEVRTAATAEEPATIVRTLRTHAQGSSNSGSQQSVQIFGFAERPDAIELLLQYQKKYELKRARVICITGNTLVEAFARLIQAGIEQLDIFMATRKMADTLGCRRQQHLVEHWWGVDGPSFFRPLKDGRMKIRYYHLPPSFAGIALDNGTALDDGNEKTAYLVNHYLWFPTLNYLKDNSPDRYHAFWKSWNVFDPSPVGDDDYTLNGHEMPSMLAFKPTDRPTDAEFAAVAGSFELVWQSLEMDKTRPHQRDEKQAIDDSNRLLQDLLAKWGRLAVKSRSKPGGRSSQSSSKRRRT